MVKITGKEVETFFKKRKNWPLLGVIVIAAIGLAVSAYFIFIYSNVCGDDACFSESLVKCKRASFIKDSPETVTQYKISRRTSDGCIVNVNLLQIKRGSAELSILEGKDMNCEVPLGTYLKPEENIKYCSGPLKESIQEIMIQRMHSQLIENIGEIGAEILGVI